MGLHEGVFKELAIHKQLFARFKLLCAQLIDASAERPGSPKTSWWSCILFFNSTLGTGSSTAATTASKCVQPEGLTLLIDIIYGYQDW
jgi:hypothetical protein